MTKRMSFIRGLSADPETEQYYGIGEEIGDRVDRPQVIMGDLFHHGGHEEA